jgi:hypothetical protein
MINFNTIRVIPFYREGDEWPIWFEKFLSTAKKHGSKDYC